MKKQNNVWQLIWRIFTLCSVRAPPTGGKAPEEAGVGFTDDVGTEVCGLDGTGGTGGGAEGAGCEVDTEGAAGLADGGGGGCGGEGRDGAASSFEGGASVDTDTNTHWPV